MTHLTNWRPWKWPWTKVIETLVLEALSCQVKATMLCASQAPLRRSREQGITQGVREQPRRNFWFWKWLPLPQLLQMMPCGLEVNHQSESALNSWPTPLSKIKWLFKTTELWNSLQQIDNLKTCLSCPPQLYISLLLGNPTRESWQMLGYRGKQVEGNQLVGIEW